MSKNFKPKKNQSQKAAPKTAQSKKSLPFIITVCIVALALICTAAVSGLGAIIDNSQKPGQTIVPTGKVITFADENLKKAVAKQCGIDADKDVTDTLVANLTNLNLSGIGEITSFDGVENLTGLIKLVCQNVKLGDVSALASLSELDDISFYDCDLSNTTSTKPLSNIGCLYLSNTTVPKELLSKFSEVVSLEITSKEALDLSAFSDMKKVESLGIYECESIADLSGVASFENLSSIEFENCNISSLSGIKNLKNLASVRLYRSTVTDISALLECSNLTSLSLTSSTSVDKNLDLSKLTKLDYLVVESFNTDNCTISGLENLTSLQTLSLSKVNGFDLNSIKNAKALTKLTLVSCGISDLSPLTSLSKLTELSLATNNITSIEPLKNLRGLTSISLSSNSGITDISPLNDCWSLTYLNANSCSIEKINLSNCTALTSLYLYSNKISDISSLSTLSKLTTLHLYSNEITDVSPLSSLTKLTSLSIYSNKIEDVSPLSKLTSLTSLDVSDNKITDVSPVAKCTKLTSFKAANNSISDISSLSTLTSLSTLDLSYNDIENISVIEKLTSLTNLNLGTNKIVFIKPVSYCVKLTTLNLSNNSIIDLSPIQTLAKLRILKVAGNQITDFSVLESETLSNLTNVEK